VEKDLNKSASLLLII